MADEEWPGRAHGLTRRESEVLVLCAEGWSNREIADRLFLNVETVKSHLKRIFRQLGLLERHETIDYLAGRRSPAPTGPRPELLSAVAIEERLALIDLQEADFSLLARFGEAAERFAPEFIEQLYRRLLANPATASYFPDRATLERLERHQRKYLSSLFAGKVDEEHVTRMVETGATHHRIKLPPQLFLAAQSSFVCDHLPMLFEQAATTEEAVLVASVLAARVVFDAALVLDAYEGSVEYELLDQLRSHAGSPAESDGDGGGGATQRRVATTATLAPDVAFDRRALIGITAATAQSLAGLGLTIEHHAPAVLEAFYLRVGSSPMADLVPPDLRPSLVERVANSWTELTTSSFDRAHVISRTRIGAVHEHIGLPSQFYLAALAGQLCGLLRRISFPAGAERESIDAVVRAVFFDATIVIDAYMEARAATLLQAGRYAEQVVAGLETSVAIVDELDRIAYANHRFLEVVGADPGVVRRLPVAAALPIPGLEELLDEARRSGAPRSAVRDYRNGVLRLSAIPMDGSASSTRQLVAVVVDDISDVVRVTARLDRTGRRVDAMLSAVAAVAWELDVESWTLSAVSASLLDLTGVGDGDALDRSPILRLLDADGGRLSTLARTLEAGASCEAEGVLRLADGTDRPVRTTMAAATDDSGRLAVFGMTVVIPG